MRKITTSVEIDASAKKVWGILTGFESYPAWNPFVRSISGRQEKGAVLAVTIQPHGREATSFKPRVLACVEPSELRWKGKFLAPKLFDGEHYLRIKQLEGGRVLLEQGEHFSGALVPLILGNALRQSTEQGFVAMNKALKLRAESAA